eukprot:2235566-Prymnesium_polylepis.1
MFVLYFGPALRPRSGRADFVGGHFGPLLRAYGASAESFFGINLSFGLYLYLACTWRTVGCLPPGPLVGDG